MNGSRMKRKAYVEKKHCVACGCCIKVCPFSAVKIYHGLYAWINTEKCVGCGRCAKECPASVIEIREVSV